AAEVPGDLDPQETAEWLESLEAVLRTQGPDRARYLLEQLLARAHRAGVELPFTANTPYVNTIPAAEQAPFPGHRDLERRLKNILLWNARAMVVKPNTPPTAAAHTPTSPSAATLYEIGFNHFWRGRTAEQPGDIIYFQGHASPGMYARAFLEGRLSEKLLDNF